MLRDKIKIFISSTMRDLKEERTTVEDAVRDLRDLPFEALRAETIGAQSASPEEVCLMMAQQCDIYLLILGGRHGYRPEGSDISVTEMEFNEAQQLGKPTLVYKKELDEIEPDQEAFIQRVGDFREGFLWREFTKDDVPEPLATWVKEDIASLISQLIKEKKITAPEGVEERPRRVLLASLGKAPGAVTGLYHALKEKEGVAVDQVLTISPRNIQVRRCVRVVQDTFREKGVPYQNTYIDADDIKDETDAFEFKAAFATLLQQQQNAGNEVYLGIAGGRTSMGALMAIVAQTTARDAVLYHLWVPPDVEEDGTFGRFFALSPQRQQEVLFPQGYELVKVPFVRLPPEAGG